MSVVNASGEKVDLPRESWGVLETIEREWAGQDPHKWRALLMLQANLFCRFTHDQIAIAFAVNQGTVTRTIEATKRTLMGLVGLQEIAAERQELRESA